MTDSIEQPKEEHALKASNEDRPNPRPVQPKSIPGDYIPTMVASAMVLLGAIFVRFWTVRISFTDDLTNILLIRLFPSVNNILGRVPTDFPDRYIILYADEFGFPGLDLYDSFVKTWSIPIILAATLLLAITIVLERRTRQTAMQ